MRECDYNSDCLFVVVCFSVYINIEIYKQSFILHIHRKLRQNREKYAPVVYKHAPPERPLPYSTTYTKPKNGEPTVTIMAEKKVGELMV